MGGVAKTIASVATRTAADVLTGGAAELGGTSKKLGNGVGNFVTTGKIGSPVATTPDPSTPDGQTALQQEQLNLLKQQESLVSGFMPFVLKQYGLQQNTDANGQVTYDYTPEQKAINDQQAVIQKQNLALETAQAQRIQDAMNGKIGPSAALSHQQDLDFQALKEDQGRLGNEIIGDSLDNATAKSTSGIQALEALRTTYGSLKGAEINNIIAGGAGQLGVYQSAYRGAAPTNATEALGGLLNPLAGVNNQIPSAINPYQTTSTLKQQNNQFNTGSQNSFTNALLTGLLGTAGKFGAAAIAA